VKSRVVTNASEFLRRNTIRVENKMFVTKKLKDFFKAWGCVAIILELNIWQINIVL
jgi:hypothetical protein